MVSGLNEAEIRAGLAPTPGYRYADLVGDELFVAGQVPLDSEGVLVGEGDTAKQVCTCLDNLKILISTYGMSLREVRHLTIYVLGDHQQLTCAWEAVVGWFSGEVPPATLLGVSGLGYGGQSVEIDAKIRRHPDD